MKMIKRTLCLLLSFIMVIGMFPMQAFATGEGLEILDAAPIQELPLLEPAPAAEPLLPELPTVPELIPEPLPESGTDGAAALLPDAAPAPVVTAAAVYFNCDPAQLSLYVYDSFGVPAVPQADGAYLLMPGSYVYCAACEGYVGADAILFTVAEGVTSLTVDVVLAPLPALESPEQPTEEPVLPEEEQSADDENLIFTETVYASFNGAAAAVDSEGSLLIDETNFPDPIFRSFISESYDTASAGRLSAAQVAAIRSMNCSGMGISSMAGIEYFTALTELTCSYNSLTELDVSRSSALTTLDCSSNALTSLNVSANPALNMLVCARNQLSSLDLSSCVSLMMLECDNNKLSTLDLSANTDLNSLNCSENSLSALDLKANTALFQLSCDNNRLAALDLSANTALSFVFCGNQSPVLNACWADGKLLYDMSALAGTGTAAVQVDGAAYDGSTGIVTLYDPAVSSNICTDFAYVLMVPYAGDKQAKLNAYATVQVPEQPGAVKINEANFPDAAFRAYISSTFDTNGSGVLSSAQIAAITEIDCSGMNIASLRGVELFTALKTLRCHNNSISYVDLSTLSALERVSATGQQVSAAALWTGDRLSFDLGALVGAENKALPVNVTGLNAVKADYSSESGLVTLDIIPADKAESAAFSYEIALPGSVLAVTVSLSVPAYDGEKVEINEANFPDEAFRSFISASYDSAALGYLTKSQLDAVSVMDCSGRNIADVKGVELFTALTELICSGNALTALDLSALAALSTLDCSGNALTALDLSANTALTTLECSDNSLAALDLSGNTALAELHCSGNALTALNLSGCTALSVVDCAENMLSELELSGCTALRSLWCGNNELSALDLSGCTALNDLRCGYNKLSTLDVSACVNLKTLHCTHNALTALDVSANAALTDLDCGYQESERNAYWQGDDLYFDLAALVGQANLAKISNVSVDRYDAAKGLVTVQLADDKDYVSEFGYDYAVTADRTMNVSVHVLRPEKPVGGDCGENVDWSYDPAAGSITISGSGDMEDYNAGGAPWNEYKDKISSIVIDSGVTAIADNAFAGFSNVSSITLSEGVSTIGDGAFAGMSSLESINIPASVTSIGSGAFSGCTALEEIRFNSKEAPSCDWNSFEGADTTVNFPASNDSWLDAMEKAAGDSGLTWRIAGTDSYSEHIKALVETYTGTEGRSIGITEDVKLDSGITVPAKLSLTVNEGVSLELKGQLSVKGSAAIYGSLSASNLTVDGSLETAAGSSISVNDLVVNGGLNGSGGSIQAKTLRLGEAADISISDGAKLDVSTNTISNPKGVLIKADAGDYSLPSEAVSENLYGYLHYALEKPESDEQLAALLALKLAKLELELHGSFSITGSTVIDKNTSLTLAEGALRVEGGSLRNEGSLTLAAELSVAGDSSFTNNGSISLVGGGIEKSEGAQLSGSGVLSFAEGFGPALEKLGDLALLGLKEAVISGDASLSADLDLPSKLKVEINGATLTIPEQFRLTRLGDDSIVLRNGACLVIEGVYDGPEIAVYKGEGCQVIPPEGMDCVERVSGDITYVSVGVLDAQSLQICDAEGEILSGDDTVILDMSEPDLWPEGNGKYYQLKAKVEPANASNRVTWKSNTTAVATVSETGLVTLLKPGTVSITATTMDAAKKSATVKMKIVYAGEDANSKLTAAIATESCGYMEKRVDKSGNEYFVGQPLNIGLQKGDRVQLYIYGADKTSPLPASLFTYEPANTTSARFVQVDDEGIITALESGSTASIKASFKDDPLKRSVTVSVKTIPVQTNRIKVLPDLQLPQIEGVDANGDLCRDSLLDAVSYAIFVDKIPAGTPTALLPSFTVSLEVKGADGNLMDISRGKHTWASTGSNIATVKENADGTATITLKANVDGACTITATSKDATKAQGSIAVYIRDYAPRLEAASLTIDSQKTGEASLGIVESYGAEIIEVEYLDKYDSKTKTYSSSGDITVSLYRLGSTDPGDSFEEVLLRFVTKEFIKNSTLNGRLKATVLVPGNAEPVSFELPLKIVVKNTAPAVTIKQLDKFNLFDKNGLTNYSFTVKNETVTDVKLDSSDFAAGDWDGEKLSVSYKDPLNVPAKPNTKALFSIYLDGYAKPVEKTVTIGTVNTKPSLALEPANLVINDAAIAEENSIAVRVIDRSGKFNIDLSTEEIFTAAPVGFSLSAEGDRIFLHADKETLSALKSAKLSLAIKDSTWTGSITVNLNITKSTAAATAKLAKTTLKLNSAYAETFDETTLSLSYANMTVDELGVAVEAVKGSDGLNVVYENGRLSANIKQGEMVPNGNYSYKLVFADEAYKPISFTVSVTNAAPSAKLSKTSVNLSASYVVQTDSFEVTAVDAKHSVRYVSDQFVTKATGAAAAEAAKIDLKVEGSTVKVSIHEQYKFDPPKAGNYTYTVNTTLDTEAGQAAAKPLTVTVRVAGNNPTAKLSKTSVTLNNVFTDYTESVQVQPTNTKAGHSVSAFAAEAKPTATNAAEIDKIDFVYDQDKKAITFKVKDEYKANPPKTGSYSFTVTGALNTDGTELGEGYFKPLNLTVRVVNTMPRLSLNSTTLNLNTAAGLASMEKGMISFVVPEGYEVVRTVVERLDTAAATLENSNKIVIDEIYEGGNIFASLDEDNLPKAASYRFRATPYVRIVGSAGEGTALSPINFNIRVYSNAKYSATVSASGKLDASLRQTSAITYTLTKLNNISGEVVSAALSGQDADKFVLGGVELNTKGQPTVKLYMKDDVNYATNVTYKFQLDFALKTTQSEHLVVSTNVLSLKVSSSTLRLTAEPKQQNIYQSQSRMRIVYYTVQLTGPEGAAIGSIEPGVTGLLQQSLINEYTNAYPTISEDGRSATIKVLIKDTSKLSANKTYTLPLLIRGAGQADNVNPTKLNLTLKVFK